MYWAAFSRMAALFFSFVGTMAARRLMPVLIVSRRRRSTSFC